MNEAKLREYAKLIVKIGANVQKGQRVRLQAGVDQVLLATMVTEECYKAGASYVELIWECGPINKLSYQYATAETLGTVQNWEEERLKQMTVDLPVRIFIDSSDSYIETNRKSCKIFSTLLIAHIYYLIEF